MIKANFELYNWIPGYEGIYQVSTWGNVRSVDRYSAAGRKIKGKYIKAEINKGYKRLGLFKNGKQKQYPVSRLVAITFIPNPLNLRDVNHKKEFEKLNNHVENLEWCTPKYNYNYGTAIKRSCEKRIKKVYQYDLTGKFIKEWPSASSVKCEGFSEICVSRCCKTNYKTHKGFFWSYTKKFTFKRKERYNSKSVYQYTKDNKLIRIWNSCTECELEGFDHRHISACCNGKENTHKGYIWSYEKFN